MTFDGMTGQSMTYNDLDLIGNIVRNDTTLVNYSYLSDGTKLSALDGSGAGLVYRGPFVYRKSAGNNNSSLTLESAAFGGGRLTPDGAMFYVTDYLGSVRAVVDGKTGELYKAADYSAFGDKSVVMVRPQGDTPPHPLATAVLPAGLTLRDGYTGKEAQTPDFSTGYTDFGARQYSPALRRWMTPDPLSEKYYGTSPYAFCNNNPVNLVDPDGRMPILVLPAIPFIVEGLKDLFFVATAAWAVYKTHEYVQEKSKYNPEYGDQQRRGNRAKGELDRAQLNIQESIERNFNKDNLNGGPHLDPNRKGEAALITFLYLVYNTAINPNTNMPYDYVVKFLTGNTDENNNDDSSSNMNGQPTILPAKTDSNSEDSDSESGDEIKDPFEYYRLKFHLYDIE